jgi:hypothetical protein
MDDERLRDLLSELERWESRKNYLYLDTATPPNVTTGIGCLLRDSAAAMALPWVVAPAGRPATRAEIAADFARVREMRGGMPAHLYQARGGALVVYLPDEAVTALALKRLRLALAWLRRLCPGFDDFPRPAQDVLVDMIWNLGAGALRKFTRMLGACNRGDWLTAAKESRVSTSRESRNAWRAQRFLDAAREAA